MKKIQKLLYKNLQSKVLEESKCDRPLCLLVEGEHNLTVHAEAHGGSEGKTQVECNRFLQGSTSKHSVSAPDPM